MLQLLGGESRTNPRGERAGNYPLYRDGAKSAESAQEIDTSLQIRLFNNSDVNDLVQLSTKISNPWEVHDGTVQRI